jgi:hypothetical protein
MMFFHLIIITLDIDQGTIVPMIENHIVFIEIIYERSRSEPGLVKLGFHSGNTILRND